MILITKIVRIVDALATATAVALGLTPDPTRVPVEHDRDPVRLPVRRDRNPWR